MQIVVDDTPRSDPDIQIAVTPGEGKYESTPLEYETYTRQAHAGTIELKCYDAVGSVVWITFKQRLLEELVFGEGIPL